MSESSLHLRRSLIVGTAGHIDHGKTTLIGALTGVDTDRLAEEKRRGISIDLGFAHLTLPNGWEISFIDVPGHERFIKNMLAGVGGIRAVLLVVDAVEGVKPQTREHFQICRLLGIAAGVVAITKIDIASAGQIAKARQEVASLVQSSFLQNEPVINVSARTGEGLPELTLVLAHLLDTIAPRDNKQLPRLSIDRSFATKGFGTVVTGTLLNGQLHTGDPVRIHPVDKGAKIRSLQVHGRPVTVANAGERTALNLTGVDHGEVERGFVLTARNELRPTSLLDVSIDWLDPTSIPTKREHYLLHAGTAEIPVHLKVFSTGNATHSRARIWLSSPALVLPGDRFILRRPSPPVTVAGGEVFDANPPIRLNRVRIDSRIKALEEGAWSDRLQLLVEESSSGRKISDLVRRTGLPADMIQNHINDNPRLCLIDSAQKVLSIRTIETARRELTEWLSDFHAKQPSAEGAPVAQARLKFDPAVALAVLQGFPAVRISGDLIALATHKRQIDPEHARLISQIEYTFRQAGFTPPAPAEVLQQAGTDAVKGRAFLEMLIKAQRLIRVSDQIVFHADVIRHIQSSLATHKGRKFSIPEFKEWTKVSRKYAVPLLEYLDRQHVTRRVGDARVIL